MFIRVPNELAGSNRVLLTCLLLDLTVVLCCRLEIVILLLFL